MYYKGGNLLNMVRTIINDDEKWRNILRGLGSTFYHQTVTYDQIVDYINQQSGLNLSPVFDQYLHYKNIPILEFATIEGKTYCRWTSVNNDDFKMPVRVKVKGGDYKFITPTIHFAPVDLQNATTSNIEVDTFNYYIGVMFN